MLVREILRPLRLNRCFAMASEAVNYHQMLVQEGVVSPPLLALRHPDECLADKPLAEWAPLQFAILLPFRQASQGLFSLIDVLLILRIASWELSQLALAPGRTRFRASEAIKPLKVSFEETEARDLLDGIDIQYPRET